jgi:hypothetical protein
MFDESVEQAWARFGLEKANQLPGMQSEAP